MVYKANKPEALKELERCLSNNKTITIPKLNRLLSELDTDIHAIKSANELRLQNKKLRKRIRDLKMQNELLERDRRKVAIR